MANLTLTLLVTAFCTAILAMNAHAQDTPESVAAEYFEAMQTQGIAASTGFMHPSALAEFKSMVMPVYQAEHESGTRQLLDMTFTQDVEFDELAAMDPVQFMNGFMSVVTAQTGNVPLNFDKLEVLGTIPEGQARHVLTRMTVGVGELAITQFEVLSFLPYEETWRLQLNMEWRGLAAALRSNLQRQP